MNFKNDKILLLNATGKKPMKLFYSSIVIINGILVYYTGKKVLNFG